jgi:hypothetical protein
MAGDRVDVDTFLERAYWKELIRTGDGSNASGKKGLSGEDEAFVMARRQSAAAAQKLLPPSHRVEVRRVNAVKTLAFRPRHEQHDKDENKDSRNKHWRHASIGELLEQIEIPVWDGGLFSNLAPSGQGATDDKSDEDNKNEKKSPLNLLDLFDSYRLISGMPSRYNTDSGQSSDKGPHDACPSDDSKYLTFAGEHGLQLPARGVLDLWQLAYWVVNDKAGFKDNKDFRAEKIARTMLRNLTAESNMSSRLGHLLQDRLIRRNPEGGTILDFKRVPLDVTYLRNQRNEFRLRPVSLNTTGQHGWATRSALKLYAVETVILSIVDIKKPGAQGHLRISELPSVVAAWLIVLHDVVLWAEKSVAIRSKVPNPQLAGAAHERSCIGRGHLEPVEVYWPAPRWTSFLAHNLFVIHWLNVLKDFEAGGTWEKTIPGFDELICRWLDCIIKTHYIFRADKPTGKGNKYCTKSKKDKAIGSAVNDIIQFIQDSPGKHSDTPTVVKPNLWFDGMQDWIEQELPLLLSPLYVPASSMRDAKECSDKVMGRLNIQEGGTNRVLQQLIMDNTPFIVARIRDGLNALFTIPKPSEVPDRVLDRRKECLVQEIVMPDSAGLFECLPAVFDDSWKLALKD